MSKDVNECIMSMNVAANLYIGLSMLSGPKRVAPTQTALDRFIRFCRAHRCAQRADRQQHGPRLSVCSSKPFEAARIQSRSSAIAEGPRDASCQLKSCQLPRNSAETTYTTSPDQIDGMKSEILSEAMRDRQCALNRDAADSAPIVSSVINKPTTLSCVYQLSTNHLLWRNFLSPQCRNCSLDPDHVHLGSTHSSQV